MDPQSAEALHDRIRRLERRLLLLQAACLLSVLALSGAALVALRAMPGQPAGAERILRVKGIVIEDERGRPRILLGAPVPAVAERRRTDAVTGLVLVGETGADRLQLGRLGGPQISGSVKERVSPATGLMVNAPDGDERGGFGAFENGQAGWGLDWPGGEGVVAAVMPDEGFAGIMLAGPSGSNRQRALLMTSADGETVLQLNDTTGAKRASLGVKGTARPSLPVFGRQGEVVFDAIDRVPR